MQSALLHCRASVYIAKAVSTHSSDLSSICSDDEAEQKMKTGASTSKNGCEFHVSEVPSIISGVLTKAGIWWLCRSKFGTSGSRPLQATVSRAFEVSKIVTVLCKLSR